MSGLNDSQQRYVLSVLATIEDHLQQVEGLMSVDHQPGENELSAIEQRRLRIFIENLRGEILGLTSAFTLPKSNARSSARWIMYMHVEFLNIQLMELTPLKLAGYGALDHLTADDLSTRIAQLRDIVEQQIKVMIPRQ